MMNSDFSDNEQAELKGYMTEILWSQAYDLYKELENEYGANNKNQFFREQNTSSWNSNNPNYGNLDVLLDTLSPHSEINDGQDYANPDEDYLKTFVRIMDANNVSNQREFRRTMFQLGKFKQKTEDEVENFLNGEFLKSLWELEFDINTD